MLKRMKKIGRHIIKPISIKPVLGDHPYGGPKDCPITFVMVVRQGFNIYTPNANSTIRLGFCRGFAQIGVRYQLVSVWDIASILPKLNKPFIFLSLYDYLDMSKAARKKLRYYPHFVWGHPNLEVMQKIYSKYNFAYSGISENVYKLVLDSEPNFIMSPTPPSGLEFYSKWKKLGLRTEAIPLACDSTRYYPVPNNDKYSDVKMAFVGGYWPKKAIQFDRYLKPYEDILTVYGYSKWPYKGYKGLLSNDDEKLLYQNANISPALSEPHAEVMGDIVERVFKIMGCGGLAITDVVPYYNELFDSEELLVPNNIDEYHDMIKKALSDESFNKSYREKGYKAIVERHTYKQRARVILKHLEIDVKSA